MMSVRDGVFSRYAVDELEDEESITVIGAPPGEVVIGGLGARAEVKAYVARVDATADELHDAFRTWLRVKWGDVPPDEQKAPTADDAEFIRKWPPWYAEWSGWVESLDTFDPFGPTPNEAWLKTEIYDRDLEAFRKLFAFVAKGTPVKVPAPGGDPGGTGGHEEPGGVKQPGLLEGLGVTDALGSVVTIVIFGALGLVAIAVAHR